MLNLLYAGLTDNYNSDEDPIYYILAQFEDIGSNNKDSDFRFHLIFSYDWELIEQLEYFNTKKEQINVKFITKYEFINRALEDYKLSTF